MASMQQQMANLSPSMMAETMQAFQNMRPDQQRDTMQQAAKMMPSAGCSLSSDNPTLTAAQNLKLEGNALHSKQQYQEAAEKYDAARRELTGEDAKAHRMRVNSESLATLVALQLRDIFVLDMWPLLTSKACNVNLACIPCSVS